MGFGAALSPRFFRRVQGKLIQIKGNTREESRASESYFTASSLLMSI